MKNPELINWKLESHKGEVNHYSRNVFFFQFSCKWSRTHWAKKGKSTKPCI